MGAGTGTAPSGHAVDPLMTDDPTGLDEQSRRRGYASDPDPRAPATGASAFTQERPLDVRPTQAGGVSIGGRSDLPEGHAGMKDKVVGKTEKVTGKMMRDPERHERGELREAGGEAAARGGARAPHD